MDPLDATTTAANPATENANAVALGEQLTAMLAAHVSVKLPTFNQFNVKRWFSQAEHQFRLGRITSPATKFSYIYTNLPQDVLNGLSEEAAYGDDYERIKAELITTFSESKPQLFDRLMAQQGNFAGLKPTICLRKIQEIANQLSVGEDIVRIKFLKSIPDDLRLLLVTYEGKSLEDMARVADTLMSYRSPVLPVNNVQTTLPLLRDPVETSQNTDPENIAFVNHISAQQQQDYSNRTKRSENFNQDRNASRGPYHNDLELRPYNGGGYYQDRGTASGFQNEIGLRPYHSGQRQVTCRSHVFFGPKAKTCKPWCWLNGSNPSLNVLPSSRPPSRSNSPHRSASPSPAPRNSLNHSYLSEN